MILSRVMLDQKQKDELIEKTVAASLEKHTSEEIVRSYQAYTEQAYEGDTKALIEDAVSYGVLTKDQADSLYN